MGIARGKKSNKKTLRKVYKKKSGVKSKSLKSLVKSEVKKTLFKKSETKMNTVTLLPSPFNATISYTGDLYNILPAIVPGVGDNNRIGNTVIPTYTNISGYLTFRPHNVLDIYHTPLGSLDVQMFILRNKHQQNGNLRTPATDLNIMKLATTKFQYDGTFASSCSPLNTEDFEVVMKKSFKLTPLSYTNPVVGTGTALSTDQVAGNFLNGALSYKFKHSINYSSLGIKKLTYDIGSDQPTDCNLFFCLGYAQYNDPENCVSDLYVPIQCSYNAVTYYKDF